MVVLVVLPRASRARVGKIMEKHADQCTPAMCVCGLGAEDGTPMMCDYIESGQWGGIVDKDWNASFDFSAVLEQAKIRMGWPESEPHRLSEYWRT